MANNFYFILSLSIIFAVIIGIVRFRKIDTAYYPFIYNCIAVLVVEIVVQVLMKSGNPQAFIFVINLYSVIDCILFTWLFYNWGLFRRNKYVLPAILIVFFLTWVVITGFIDGFTQQNYYFRILYSFALIFFSVSTFNKMVVNERGSIFKNAKFWICLGVIIFYTFFILVCVTRLSLFNNEISKAFRGSLQVISAYSNFLVNILYAVAILCIPRKKNFTMLF